VHELAWLESFGSNLAAGFLGALLTVTLIDRRLERQHKALSTKVRKVAFNKIRPTLSSHIGVLSNWQKAAAQHPPEHLPQTIEDVFDESYFRDVRTFDFSKSAPTLTPMSWFMWTPQSFKAFREQLSIVVDTYVAFLEPDTIERFESLANSTIVLMLIQMPNMPEIDARLGTRRRYNMFWDESIVTELRRHVTLLKAIVAEYNSIGSEPIEIAELNLWRDDVAPKIGSSRIAEADHAPNAGPIFSPGGPPRL
jgi:hypothetical protein